MSLALSEQAWTWKWWLDGMGGEERKKKLIAKWSRRHKSTWETMFRQPKMMIKVSTFLRVLFIPFLWKKGGSFLHSNVAAFHIGMATFRLTTTDGWEGKDSAFCTSNICHLKSSQNFMSQKIFCILEWGHCTLTKEWKELPSFFRWQM